MLDAYTIETASHQAKTGTDARGQATHGAARQIAIASSESASATQTDRTGEASEANAYLTTAEIEAGDLINGRKVKTVKSYKDPFTGAVLYRKAVTE